MLLAYENERPGGFKDWKEREIRQIHVWYDIMTEIEIKAY